MDSVYRDIEVVQGSTFEFPVRVKRNGTLMDLTGYTARMQIRNLPADDVGSSVLATATVTVDIPTSIVTARINADITQAFTWSQGVYDLEIDGGAPDKVYCIARGRAGLSKEVTR